MYDRRVDEVMDSKLVVAAPDASAREAAGLMQRHRTGAVLVMQGGALTGIFTERDLACRVVAAGRDPARTPLAEVMTPAPRTIAPHRPFGVALAMMHKHGFRHVPVVQGVQPIGMLSSRQALDPEMEDFIAEERRRVHFEAEELR